MKLDSLVLQRLDELLSKGTSILQARTFAFTSAEGKQYFYVSSPDVQGWGTSVLNLLQRIFNESSIHYKIFHEQFKKYDGYESSFNALLSILTAAKEDYSGGYLFNLRSLAKAEILDDATEQAKVLLDSGFKDPACVVIGISLELTIKEIANRVGVDLGKLDKMNADLCKAGIYNMAKQKQITAWAELRNKAAHGDWTTYNADDVQDMLTGVQRFIADYL